MDTNELEEKNRSKYGDKDFDIISQNYRISKEHGDVWCANNVIRYLDRFKRPGSGKGNNMVDLYKSRDYLNRMIEENEKLNGTNNEEVIEQNQK